MIPQRRRMDAHAVTTPVLLGDGQSWDLPVPYVHTRPGKPSKTTLGRRFDELVDAAQKADTRTGFVVSMLNLCAFLVRQNYYVTNRELETLLAFDPDARDRLMAEIAADPDTIHIFPTFGTDCLLDEIERVAFGSDDPPTYERWVRLSIMAAGSIPDALPISDWHDLAAFLETTGRTIGRDWVPEIRLARADKQTESLF